jgi:hypothetical protein
VSKYRFSKAFVTEYQFHKGQPPSDRPIFQTALSILPVTTAESGVHALGVLGLDQMKAEASAASGASEKVCARYTPCQCWSSLYAANPLLFLSLTGCERVAITDGTFIIQAETSDRVRWCAPLSSQPFVSSDGSACFTPCLGYMSKASGPD